LLLTYLRRKPTGCEELIISSINTACLHSWTRFRWAFCQLEYLRHGFPQRIRQALEELPETLDDTYDRTLEEIGKRNWKYAHRLFQCVATASRPLRVEELAEFLAFDFDAASTPTFREDWREEDPAHVVRSTCSSLLAIVDVDGSPVIQFSHFSVKEYLTSKRLFEAKDTISRFHISMTPAHTIVAQACLGILLHIEEYITENRLNSFPLAEYAAKHWVGHARFGGVSPSIQDGTKRLFDPNNCHLAVWTWIYDPESRSLGHRRSERLSTPLHYAALYGFHQIIEFLIVERSQDVNARGFSNDETPLLVASRKGHSEVARVLLGHGADTEIRDNSKLNWSPLERASNTDHVESVRVLLEHGAKANAQDSRNLTALHVASYNGQPAATRVLLEYGADVNAKDSHDLTPLHKAQNKDVARVLLEHGADVNAQGPNNQTPLNVALREGRAAVARLLLEHGADAGAHDSKLASRSDYNELVRLLLQPERGSGIHARDNTDQTQFQVPSTCRHDDIMLLLLEHWHEAEDHGALLPRI
jgi:ankyrin repeat protein